uniref:PIR2-like helical domain-containing protein n=1 Tax=Oryza punctata TaxID=4537 RepID=A0A0E0KHT3_ORYPU
MASKRRRSGAAREPLSERPYRYEHEDRIVRNRSALLDAINGYYAAALDRLPVEEMPALIPRLLKSGLCAGFSDPISNIVVNTLSHKRLPERKPMVLGCPVDAKTAARRRRSTLSHIVSDVTWYSPNHSRLRDMRMPLRSLEALVAFLVTCFPYLPTWEALQYLRAARRGGSQHQGLQLRIPDHQDRAQMRRHRCVATQAQSVRQQVVLPRRSDGAGLRDPSQRRPPILHRRSQPPWIAHEPTKISRPRRSYRSTIPSEQDQAATIRASMDWTSKFLPSCRGISCSGATTGNFLQRRYHREFLKAGHCYGPFMNPAHSIVLNTVWYDTMFPAEEESEVAMICSRNLVSSACRSLLGLVAYLRACFPTVSKQQAIRYQLLAEVNLQRAIEMAGQEGHTMKDKFDRGIGFKAAATAAHHPDRDALVNFYLSSFFGPLPLKACGSFHVQLLSLMLSQKPFIPSHCSFKTVPVLTEGASRLLSKIKQDFEAEQGFICSKGPEYDLHVICGLNPYVIKSGVSPLHYGERSCKIRITTCAEKVSEIQNASDQTGFHVLIKMNADGN